MSLRLVSGRKSNILLVRVYSAEETVPRHMKAVINIEFSWWLL